MFVHFITRLQIEILLLNTICQPKVDKFFAIALGLISKTFLKL